jgi:hypothetical protein
MRLDRDHPLLAIRRRARPHRLPEVRYERSNEMGSRLQHVRERASGRRPAERREEVLLAVDRNRVQALAQMSW